MGTSQETRKNYLIPVFKQEIGFSWRIRKQSGGLEIIEEGLNKTPLVSAVAEKTGLTKKDADKAVNALFEVVTETLADGERVQVVGFGTFEVRDRAARKGRNPQTGEVIDIAAAKLPAFKAGKALRQAVDK